MNCDESLFCDLLKRVYGDDDAKKMYDNYKKCSKSSSRNCAGCKDVNNVESLADLALEVYKLIGSPYLSNRNGSSKYIGQVIHTEQMIDWIRIKYKFSINIKISSKAPCNTCSHYIQNAEYRDGFRVHDMWCNTVVIGFNTGWDTAIDDQNDDVSLYYFPIKVFNANDGNGHRVTKTLRMLTDNNGNITGNVYDAGEFGNTLGIDKSNIYAIDDISNYDGQLTMNDDGTVVEYTVNGARYQRSADEPVLLSVTSKDITLDECESDDTQLSDIQKWWQEQREGHKAIRQWIEQTNNTVLQKLKNIFKI